eukprot:NODE_14146_length_1125_cov_8.490982.p1 GENE.NODE_14146_length_1125_cov_8.490982~~NODE_14146_length_1125_cov_8.490982.p1  ORF type:complete len:308 (+),score=106.13 NODE_14146_length_1125_cov_8.490982:34-924(+)
MPPSRTRPPAAAAAVHDNWPRPSHAAAVQDNWPRPSHDRPQRQAAERQTMMHQRAALRAREESSQRSESSYAQQAGQQEASAQRARDDAQNAAMQEEVRRARDAVRQAEDGKYRAEQARQRAEWDRSQAQQTAEAAQRRAQEAHRRAQEASQASACSHYEVLGLQPSCSERDIKDAYRKLTKHIHPDKADKSDSVQSATTRMFRQVQEAYETLTSPDKRRAYDRAHGFGTESSTEQVHQGDRVRIKGLAQAAQYNGKEARVLEASAAQQTTETRISVQVVSEGKVLAVKRSNLDKL